VETIEEVLGMALGFERVEKAAELPAASGDLMIAPAVPLLHIRQD